MVEEKIGFTLEKPKPYSFKTNGDLFGWQKAKNGKWFLSLYIEHGRIKDTRDYKLKTGLRKIAELKTCDFRLTGNQGLVIGAVEGRATLLQTEGSEKVY